MARSRGPQNLVARDVGRGAESRAHADYDAMLSSDLGGRRATSYRAIDDGRPAGAAELLLRPLTLFLLACLTLALLVLIWAWQSGVIGSLLPRQTHDPARPSPTAWMAGRADRGLRPVDERGKVDVDAAPVDTQDDAENANAS